MVWSLAPCSDNAKQHPVVYSAGFEAVFLVKGPRTTSIQRDFSCLGLWHSGLEGECHFCLVVELT